MTKSNSGKKRFISSYDSPSLREVGTRTQRRNLEAGTEAEAMEECCLLACSSCPVQFVFLCTPGQDHLPRGDTCSQWAEAFHINHNWIRYPPGLPTGQPNRSIFSAEVPSSQMTLAWVKLIKTSLHNHSKLQAKCSPLALATGTQMASSNVFSTDWLSNDLNQEGTL